MEPEEQERDNEASVTVSEPRPLVEETAYESAKLKELGWSRTATRVRPLKGWFGLAEQSKVLTSRVDLDGTRRILERVRPELANSE
jgi:hypothetical protein